MIQLLADENIPPAVVGFLREKGSLIVLEREGFRLRRMP